MTHDHEEAAMATAGPARGTRRHAPGERVRKLRASRSYRPVLLLVIASFLFTSFAPNTDWARAVVLLSQTATLMVALWTARTEELGIRLVVVAAAGALAVLQLFIGGRGLQAAAAGMDGVFVATTAIVIGRGVLGETNVNQQSVVGAICVYLLVGMLFAFFYGLIAAAGSGPLFAQGTDGTPAVRQYFSFVTMTTTGYGDYTAANALARTLAVGEALFGQLYLVTVIAVLVSRMRPRRASGE
ncbi:MAG: potassium channel family protein [Solirubrobacteraceae bacterium]